MVGEEANLTLGGEEQVKQEEATKPKPIEPYRPPVPFPQRHTRPNLRLNLEILRGTQEIAKQYPIFLCHIEDALLCQVF